MIATVEELLRSVEGEEMPPEELDQILRALWFTKKGDWEQAHTIVQDIETQLGCWIHALLHVIEGDQWNADYWFSRANRPKRGPGQVDEEWIAIAKFALGEEP